MLAYRTPFVNRPGKKKLEKGKGKWKREKEEMEKFKNQF